MTSSLVGSEMCIRDSHMATPPLGKCEAGGRWVGWWTVDVDVWMVDGYYSVSYTHLTLPTICSV
eukprot:7024761-Prorocentrum_lima.AAC.1